MALRSWGGGRPIESIRIPHCWGVFWKFQVESNRDNRVSGSKKIRTSSTTDPFFCTKSRLDERLPEPCSWVSNVSGRFRSPGCTVLSHPDLWVGVLLNRLREAENLMSLGTGSQLVVFVSWLGRSWKSQGLKISQNSCLICLSPGKYKNSNLTDHSPTDLRRVKWRDSNILSAPDCLQWTKSQVFGGRQEVPRAPWGTKIAG
jgi:hypothetical protein